MIQPFNITRGGIEYTVYEGSENGKSRLYMETVAPNSEGLRERWYWVSLYMEAGNMSEIGEASYIKTLWKRADLSPAGNVIKGTQQEEPMETKAAEIIEFVEMAHVSRPILMFMANGLVRYNLGFNHLPIFDALTGAVKTYTAYEESTPPTNDYNTWNEGDPLPEILTEPTPEP